MANTKTSPFSTTQSKASLTTVNNRIILTDPNEIISQQTGGQNAIPDYETMSPFVEMYAIRKEGVEIVLGENGNYEVKGENLASKINFLNFDIPTQSYTTNYTGDIVGTPDRDANEGFGISAISVKMNANYMPMVEATFIDIKGSSVIRPGDKSPLAALFDFPSPIFKMRLKGAFGKFVEYDLHMTGNDIEYTDSGDFIIKAKFIGEYFGPLTDVLLGYLKSVPYLKGMETALEKSDSTTYELQSGEKTTVNSFFELVNRGELLYTKIAEYQSNTTKTKKISDKKKGLDTIPDLRRKLAGYDDFNKDEVTEFSKKQDPPVGGLNGITFSKDNGNPHTLVLSTEIKYDTLNLIYLINPLTTFIEDYMKNKVVAEMNLKVEELRKTTKTDFLKFENMVTYGENKKDPTTYSYFINYSKLVAELDRIHNTINDEISLSIQSMQKDAELIIKNNIDFRPSIRNVFEILLNDFDSFLTILKSSGEATKPLGTSQFLVDLRKPLIQAPYPEVVKKKIMANTIGVGTPIEADVLVYPGTIKEFRDWDEVKLVELYCKSLVSQLKIEQQVNNQITQANSGNYIPLYPLEAYGNPANDANPYQSLTNPSDLFKEILLNYVTLRDFAYGVVMDVNETADYSKTIRQVTSVLSGNTFIINLDTRKKLVELLAKSEARNIANALSGTNTMAQMLIELSGSKDKIASMRLKIDKTTLGVDKSILGNNEGVYFATNHSFPKLSTERKETYKNVRYRSDENFNGIKGIINPDDTEFRKLIEPISPVTAPSDFDNERTEMLNSIKGTVFGSDDTYKATVSAANTLIFPDSERESNPSDTDGMTDFCGLSSYFLLTTALLENAKLDPNGLAKVPATLGEFFSGNKEISGAFKLRLGNDSAIIKKFLYPGAVEIPYWCVLYMGYVLSVNESNSFSNILSEKDKAIFVNEYNNHSTLLYGKEVLSLVNDDAYIITNKKDEEIKTHITAQEWFKTLISKRYIINNSSTTFLEPERLELTITPLKDKGFRSAELTSGDPTLTYYLNTLFNEVQKKLTEYTKKNEAEITQEESRVSDPDFKLNVYMSFKTIYDRWLAGNNDYIGQSGQKAANPLRERFKFITRSQQDIGDLGIVDFKNFLADSKNPDMNVFTTISNLLGQNQYMFFPLHSFMEYNKGNTVDNWESNFKIQPKYSEQTLSKPSFVCMYIGSYSSRLNVGGTGGNYGSDGFSLQGDTDLPSDFSGVDGGNVFAFNVKVGSQSQMIFSSFTANTTEFKNTDVSLKIQDDIINKQTSTNRIGKAQNLLNIYNQRSYTMGVTIPFGNMCIQPTQYFEISGIPIWNGIYMIHEVSHAISAGVNRMVTQFKGYKLGKYTFPVVTDYLLSYLGISNEFGGDISGFSSVTNVAMIRKDVLDKVNELDPNVKALFCEFLSGVASLGWTTEKIVPLGGRRTYEDQVSLAERGLGPYPKRDGDVHMNGWALDCNFTKGNIKLMKNDPTEKWLSSGIPQLAKSLGMRWGGNFTDYKNDNVHFDAGPNGIPGPRTAPVITQGPHTQTYVQTNDTGGLFLSSLLPFGADNARFAQEVRTLAADLKINPNALMAAMYLESEFKTTARAKTSSAAGLIQFVTPTAIGYTDFYNDNIRPQAKLPTNGLSSNIIATLNPFDQLKLVGEFLERNLHGAKNRKNNFFNVSFSIFNPASQQEPDAKIMFDKDNTRYLANREFDVTNKGNITVGDYKSFILNRIEKELGILPNTFLTITA